MIFTTNKSLKAWGRVLHDEDLAQAIIDRVLERGRLLRLDGPSVRTLHVNLDEAMKEESDQQADLVRISGKSRSEFPEPTQREEPSCTIRRREAAIRNQPQSGRSTPRWDPVTLNVASCRCPAVQETAALWDLQQPAVRLNEVIGD